MISEINSIIHQGLSAMTNSENSLAANDTRNALNEIFAHKLPVYT